ncbi:Hypothetical predicted protein, partial [Paramuricea clavata]
LLPQGQGIGSLVKYLDFGLLSGNYSQFQLTFHRKIPKFIRNFQSTFLIWEVGRELRNELLNEFRKYDLQNKRVHGVCNYLKWTRCWIGCSPFKGKLDDTTSAKVFQTLKANGFNTTLQLKLLTREQIDVMFQTDISLGTKSLLLYKFGVLCENSPLQPIGNMRKKIQKNEEESSQPQARKNVLSALQTQADVLKDKIENQRAECRELQINIDSMDIVVRPLEAKLNAMKMELSKRKAAINDLDTQVA